MSGKKMGLGRGLNTLIPKAPIVDEEEVEQVKKKVSIHGTYEDVAEDNDDPIGTSSLCGSGEHQDNLHHGGVADGKSTDTQEGKCVGKVTQQNFK